VSHGGGVEENHHDVLALGGTPEVTGNLFGPVSTGSDQ
jgi:hypothetical protein